jgi:hypothetical protein
MSPSFDRRLSQARHAIFDGGLFCVAKRNLLEQPEQMCLLDPQVKLAAMARRKGSCANSLELTTNMFIAWPRGAHCPVFVLGAIRFDPQEVAKGLRSKYGADDVAHKRLAARIRPPRAENQHVA